MSTQTVFLTAGATSKSVDLALVQKAAAANPGDPITGLAFNTASFTAYYRKGQTGALTAITLATQTVGGAFSSGGFVEISSTNAPGGYRFDIPDTVLAAVGEANIWFNGAANLATHMLKIIVTDMDFYDRAVNFRKAMTEAAMPAIGSPPTPEQALIANTQKLFNGIYGATDFTARKFDNVTISYANTFDSSTPSAWHRTT